MAKWLPDDIKDLKELIKKGATRSILLERFKDRTWDSIEKKLKREELDVPQNESGLTTIDEDIEKERKEQEAKVFKDKYKKVIKTRAFQERLIVNMQEAIETLPTIKPPKKITPPKPSSVECPIVVNWSDWHGGESVEIEEMGELSEYSFDIMAKRVEHMVDTILKIVVSEFRLSKNIQDMHLLLEGDMISGLIHEELKETADKNLFHAIFGVAFILSQAILDLSPHFRTIEVTGVCGNHGRTTKERRFKEKYVNYDYFIYNIAAALLKNQKNVNFDLPFCFFKVKDIAGHLHLILHGDNIRFYRGVPWYGISNMVSKFTELLASRGEYIEYINLAHFHNAGTLARVKGEITLNGSLIGGTQFSLGAMFSTNEPRQTMYLLHPEQGKIHECTLQFRTCDDHAPCRYSYSEEAQFVSQIRGL